MNHYQKPLLLTIQNYYLICKTCIIYFRGPSSPGIGDRSQSVDVQKLYKLQEELTELHKKRGEVYMQTLYYF